jgi:hypothetical protein
MPCGRITSLKIMQQRIRWLIWLKTLTVFRLVGGNTSLCHGVINVRQTEIYTAQSPVPRASAFEVEVAIEKVKRHKSPNNKQIPAELLKLKVG